MRCSLKEKFLERFGEDSALKLTFLGTNSQNGGSPTLFKTDRGTLVVRGYAITDDEARGKLGNVPPGELDIEIPLELLEFAANPMAHHPRWLPSPEDSTEEQR